MTVLGSVRWGVASAVHFGRFGLSPFAPRSPAKLSALFQGIQLLLQKAPIVAVPPAEQFQRYYSLLFLVQKASGGLHPVLDFKGMNHFIPHVSFKMASLQQILLLLRQGKFLTSIDLLDAYLHVPVQSSQQRYLQFAVQSKHFHFCVLPFKQASAHRVFTKLLAPLVGILHSKGI